MPMLIIFGIIGGFCMILGGTTDFCISIYHNDYRYVNKYDSDNSKSLDRINTLITKNCDQFLLTQGSINDEPNKIQLECSKNLLFRYNESQNFFEVYVKNSFAKYELMGEYQIKMNVDHPHAFFLKESSTEATIFNKIFNKIIKMDRTVPLGSKLENYRFSYSTDIESIEEYNKPNSNNAKILANMINTKCTKNHIKLGNTYLPDYKIQHYYSYDFSKLDVSYMECSNNLLLYYRSTARSKNNFIQVYIKEENNYKLFGRFFTSTHLPTFRIDNFDPTQKTIFYKIYENISKLEMKTYTNQYAKYNYRPQFSKDYLSEN